MCFLPADECKAKWKSLVDYYREWLKIVADMTRSGSAAKVPGKTRGPFHETRIKV